MAEASPHAHLVHCRVCLLLTAAHESATVLCEALQKDQVRQCTCLQVPQQFAEDLFSVLGESGRPDYRWLIMGPARSGASFHKDPNATSAWNAVVKGSKKWVLFPPHVVPPGVPGHLSCCPMIICWVASTVLEEVRAEQWCFCSHCLGRWQGYRACLLSMHAHKKVINAAPTALVWCQYQYFQQLLRESLVKSCCCLMQS